MIVPLLATRCFTRSQSKMGGDTRETTISHVMRRPSKGGDTRETVITIDINDNNCSVESLSSASAQPSVEEKDMASELPPDDLE
jgi:hypothetical protein